MKYIRIFYLKTFSFGDEFFAIHMSRRIRNVINLLSAESTHGVVSVNKKYCNFSHLPMKISCECSLEALTEVLPMSTQRIVFVEK